jgi:DNA-binding MarR family transcriptional regulator
MPRKKPVTVKANHGAQNGGDVTDPSRIDVSTGYLVRKTFRAFTRSLEQRLSPHKVSMSMWFFLRVLWEQDGVAQKELADELGLTQATTVAAMDVMEKRGLIERRENNADRRRSDIFLTKEGHALKNRLLRYAVEVNSAAHEDMSARDLAQLRELLNRLIRSLNKDAARSKEATRLEARSREAKPASARRSRKSR